MILFFCTEKYKEEGVIRVNNFVSKKFVQCEEDFKNASVC